MFKKGEKSLQMIFGLFILLIISLVVLSLFFKFIGKSSSQTEALTTKYFSESQIGQVKQECENLCGNIRTDDDVIEFCRTFYPVDWNGNNIQGDLINQGKWQFCEDKIPCFLIYDCGEWNGEKCKNFLQINRPDFLSKLAEGGPFGSCGMPDSGYNWMKKYGYNESSVITP